MTFQEIIAKIGKGQKGAKHLSAEEAQFAMNFLLEGKASPYQVGAFLISLRIKEESPEELTAFTLAARSYLHSDLKRISQFPEEVLDLPFYAGKKNSFHVGIPASFIMAGAGLKVVMHGDPDPPGRTSKSMILHSLGWDKQTPLKDRLDFFQTAGWCYLEIDQIHPSFKNFLDLRNEIGLRSVFHTIARFLNPLNAANQIIGVSHPKSFEKIGESMKLLGVDQGIVIRGLEGESEANLSGPLDGMRLDHGTLSKMNLDPATLGLLPIQRSEIEIDDVASEAKGAVEILEGRQLGDKRMMSLWNAAIGLHLSGIEETLKESYFTAKDSLDSGNALKIFKEMKNHQPITRRS
ncbi:MAG: anthranilate phosphoribosyltransferase [Nitrospiria bacterium]